MNKNKTVMFADISGSTHLYEVLNDNRAKEVIAQCLNKMSRIAVKNSGRVIKTIGDEILCTFPDPNLAALSAIEMQEAVSLVQYSENNTMGLHIGFHHGEIIIDNDDIFGDTVNIAARVVSKAKRQQIITTADTLELMDETIKPMARLIVRARIKGKSEAMTLYEIVWGEPEDLTIVTNIKIHQKEFDLATDNAFMILKFNDRKYFLNEASPLISLGRSDDNLIAIHDNKVSRLHATIELRHDKFVFIDQSVNGSYIHPENEETKFIRGIELTLENSGYITLAKKLDPTSPFAVHYQYGR